MKLYVDMPAYCTHQVHSLHIQTHTRSHAHTRMCAHSHTIWGSQTAVAKSGYCQFQVHTGLALQVHPWWTNEQQWSDCWNWSTRVPIQNPHFFHASTSKVVVFCLLRLPWWLVGRWHCVNIRGVWRRASHHFHHRWSHHRGLWWSIRPGHSQRPNQCNFLHIFIMELFVSVLCFLLYWPKKLDTSLKIHLLCLLLFVNVLQLKFSSGPLCK